MGTQTFDQWYNDTLLSRDEFIAKWGSDFYARDIIDYFTFDLDYDWNWADWAAEYEAANG